MFDVAALIQLIVNIIHIFVTIFFSQTPKIHSGDNHICNSGEDLTIFMMFERFSFFSDFTDYKSQKKEKKPAC